MSELEPTALELLGVRLVVVYDGTNGVGDRAIVIRFGNGYGASVVQNQRTNTHPPGTFEVLPLRWSHEGVETGPGLVMGGHPCYDTPLADDVIMGLDWLEAGELLRDLADLPGALR